MIELQIRLLVYLAIGWWIGKKKIIDQNGAAAINTLVMNLILPCSIFHAFETPLSKEILQSTFSILILAVLLQAASILISKPLYAKVKNTDQRLNLEYGTVSNNAGTLGLVVGQAAFGQQGALYTSIYAIPLRIVMWSYGLMMYSKSKEISWKDLLIKTATNPCMIAIFAGIIIMVLQSFGFALPEWIDTIISSIGSCNTVLIMIVIGIILSDLSIRDLFQPSAVVYTCIRLLILPVLTCLILAVFGVRGMPLMICTLECAMPAPVTMAMLSQKYKRDEAFASRMIFLSTIASMVTLPLWTMFLTSAFPL